MDRLSNVPKVIQLISGGTRIQTSRLAPEQRFSSFAMYQHHLGGFKIPEAQVVPTPTACFIAT
jgi:hypothetical protein